MRVLPEVRGLWALGWRMLLLMPLATVVGSLGIILLTLVLAMTVFAPVLATLFVITGQYWWAFATIGAWIPWLKFGGPVRRLVFEGFEHGSL